ncbi:MAG: energy transducer TonB [Terracidiphilus sp.]
MGTQSGSSSAAVGGSLTHGSEGLAKITVTRRTPAIEWPAPENITYGAPLTDTQLNATSSAPGTLEYYPGAGAVLTAGEHTLFVVFTPSNESEYAPAQAAVPLSVVKATPSIGWPTPDPINNTTPLGSAQFNARASVPGTFAYSRATGEILEPGLHILSVTFTPADGGNYTEARASVSLTVIESVPARIAWRKPPSISYGTVLGDEQFDLRSSVPGSFLCVPALGNVLPPGEHKLSVIFTPEDQVKYTEARAAVTLIVEALPIVAPLLNTALPTQEAGYASNESLMPPRESLIPPGSPDAAEVPASEPESGEELQADVPLFGAFRSSIEEEHEQKTTNKWLMIFSAVTAIPMLCVLIFLVAKAHSGAPFVASLVARPSSAAAQPQSQSNSQDLPHQVQMTVNQVPAGTAAGPAPNSQPDNNEHAAKPAQGQNDTTHDQVAAQTDIPQGSKKQTAASMPSSGSSGTARANGSEGSHRVANRETQSTDREEASNPVVVSADAAAGRLMESRIPIYPPIARASGVSGTVKLDAIISKDGTVKDLRVVSGPAQLRDAAVHAVRAWVYRPFMVHNEPTEVQTTINVVFSLDR